MIAGIHQGNVRESPYVNMKAAVTRRNYALDRMVANGYIKKAEAEAIKKQPIVVHGEPNQSPSIAPYFVETVRQHLEDQYGSKARVRERADRRRPGSTRSCSAGQTRRSTRACAASTD